MSTLQNGDSFLVQRTDSQSGISTNYQVSQENLMANLADDDLLLVQRTSAGISTNYSITGSALKEDLGGVDGLIVPPVEVLTPINGAGITEFDQYEPLSSVITAVGEAGTIVKETDAIQSVTDLSTGAVNLDRNNASWINIPSGVSIGTSEFTLECFFYVDSFNDYGTIFDSRVNGATENNQIFLGTDSQNRVYFWTVDGSGNYSYRYEKPVNAGQWYHLALVRDSNNLMHLYIDGTHATKISGDYYHSGSINSLTRLGQSQEAGFANNGTYFEFDGKLSNVRVTVGQALYTSDFTVPLTPLTTTSQNAIASNVKLLCCQSTTDVTAAAVSPGSLVANGHAVSTSGPGGSDILLSFPTDTNFNALSVGDIVQGADAVDNGGSVYLDGNAVIKISTDGGAASIFNIPANTAFTIEAWVYPTNLRSYNNIMSGWDSSCGYHGVLFHILDNGQIFFGGLGGATHTSNASNPVTLNNWHHVAVTRNNGNDCEFFIDGVSAGTFNNNHAADNHNCGVFIGANMDGSADNAGGYADYRWTGYISNLRYVVGHETYTSNFTPSTEQLTKTSQGVPSGSCRFLALQDKASYSTNSLQVDGLSAPMTAVYGTPVASEQNPFGVPVTPVAITSINDAATPPTITVDGGTWTTSDRLTGHTSYEKSLTFTDTTELDNMVAPLEMADATGSNSLTPITSNVVSTSFTPSASYFNALAYTGNNSVNVQNFITGVDIQNNGGMIWFKSKTSGQAGRILDTYGGTRASLIPSSDSLRNNLGADGLTFKDDGFSIGWAGGDLASSNDYIAWSFREAPGFFDIVTWTGNGSSSREISHNLGSTPGFIMVKKTAAGSNRDWWCWHKSISTGDLSANDLLRLNKTNGIGGTSPLIGTASSTMFEIAGDDNVNGSGNTYIAYVFADNPSTQIKCGSYLGNATNGAAPAVPNQIDCGFRPKFLLIKNAGNSTNWLVFDDQRGDKWIYADEPDPEGYSNPAAVVFNDTGFSLPTGLHYVNQDNTEHIFMAIGEAGIPDTTELTFQDNTALSALTSGMTITSDRTPTLGSLFSTYLYEGTNSALTIDNGIDLAGEGGLVWISSRNRGRGNSLYDTERGVQKRLMTDSPSNQQDTTSTYGLQSFTSSGFNLALNWSGDNEGAGATHVAWTFRKASGFFDVVTWEGNDTNRQIAHNLGSVPGFIIVKRYSANEDWTCYHKSLGATNYIQLNDYNIDYDYHAIFNDTEPTSTHFSIGDHGRVNTTDQSYVAYVFADNPSKGIKCGSYTGTGADNNSIECGFEPTWVMIKNVDENGASNNDKSDWYISDSQRGFSSHYGSPTGKSLSANASDTELTDANIVVSATGFKPATGGAEYNKSGIKYIYIAIGSPTGMSSIPTGTLTADADPSTNTASVAATSWPTGDSVTGPSLSASLTSILEISGSTIFGNGPTGTWMSGYYAEGSQINDAPPGPSEITFTSQNQGTPAFSGVDATLASRTWTLESGASATGPWTVVDSYVDYDLLNSQDGATPWSSNKPNLTPNTFYRVKVQYNSTNAESVESVYHTFKTGDA